MAYIQKVTPLPNKILNFTLRNFVGGLNNRSEQLKYNEASNVLNMRFADDTVMEKRNGVTYYDEMDLDDELIFIDEYKPYDGSDQLIRATKEKMYVGIESSGSELISTLITDSLAGKPCGTNYMSRYFFVDGDKLYVWGIFPQTTETPHVVVTGTPVEAECLMEVVNPTVDFTPISGADIGVTKYNYTEKTISYEPCQAQMEHPKLGANVVPDDLKYLISHGGRLFASGCNKDNDNIFITDVENPYYFPVYTPMQVPPDSDRIRGLIVYDDSVIVGRENDMYVITGKTSIENTIGVEVFQIKRINTHTGIANNDAMDVCHNYLFYLGSDGNVYSLSSVRNDQKILSTTIISKTLDLFKEPFSLTHEGLLTASSAFYKDEWYLTIKDIVLIYSYRHQAWTLWDNLYARCFCVVDNIFIWGNEFGKTCMNSTDYYDYGRPFRAFWASKYFDMDDASSYKQFREFYLVAHTYEAYNSNISVVFEIDYVDIKDKYVVSNQIAIFGRAKWGDRFITRNIVHSLPFVVGRRGRAIRVMFSNGYYEDEPVDIYDELLVYPNRKEGMLVYVMDEEKYYLYTDYRWVEQTEADLNQCMKVYQVNGDFEFRGKR